MADWERVSRRVSEVAGMSLSGAEWQQVHQILVDLGDALLSGDDGLVRRLAGTLVVYGTGRVGRGANPAMGGSELTPVPAHVQELINELVHRLTPEDTEPDDAEQPADR